MQLGRMPAVLAATLLAFTAGCSSTCCHKQCAPRVTAAPPCPCPGPGPCPAPCPGPGCPAPIGVAAPAGVAVPAVPAPAVESRFPTAPPTALPYNPTPPAPTSNNI
jgi:hypothetical protein